MKSDLSPKVEAMYNAVLELILEGADISKIKVIDITNKAGIGKGTAYEYFRSREEIIGNALIHYRESWMSVVNNYIQQIDGFINVIDYLFELVKQNSIGEKRLLFRSIIYVMHNAADSKELQEIMRMIAPRTETQCTAGTHWDFITEIIRKAQENGEITKEYPLEYIQCALTGKIFSYLMYCVFAREENLGNCSSDEMRKMLVGSIRKEFCIKNDA